MFAVTGMVLLALVASAHPSQRQSRDDKVQVGYYAESLCPDCIAFSRGPMNDAVNEVYIYK